MFFKKITINFSSFLSSFWNYVCSLVNIFCMLFCIEIEQSNMGCNEIKSRIVAKLSSLPWREQSSKEDEVKKKKKKKRK